MPKVSFRMASASRESVFGVQTNTARKIHRSDHTEGRLTTAPSGCCLRKGTPCGHFACIRPPFPVEPVPRVPQHPPDEMPDEGATTGTSHDARLHARASAPAANSSAPALDDTSAPVLTLSPLSGRTERVRGPPADTSIQRTKLASGARRPGDAQTPCTRLTPSVDRRPPSTSQVRMLRRARLRIQRNSRYFTSSRTPSASATSSTAASGLRYWSTASPTSSARRWDSTWAASRSPTSPAGAKTVPSTPSANTQRPSARSRGGSKTPSVPAMTRQAARSGSLSRQPDVGPADARSLVPGHMQPSTERNDR
jgi:hypothetical protein